MQRKKETTPRRQANRVEYKSNHRLSQEEWNELWNRDGWALIAMFGVLFAVMTGVL